MKKRLLSVLLCTTMGIALLAGCGSNADETKSEETVESEQTDEAETRTQILTRQVSNLVLLPALNISQIIFQK